MQLTSGNVAAFGAEPCAACAPAGSAPPPSSTPAGGGASVVLHSTDEPSHWISIRLLDRRGRGIAGAAYRVTLPDGALVEGSLDAYGRVRIEGIPAGTCRVVFPEHDVEREQASSASPAAGA